MNRRSLSSLSLSSSVWSLLISSLPPAPSTYILLSLSLCLHFCLLPLPPLSLLLPWSVSQRESLLCWERFFFFFLPTQWTEHEQWQWIGSDVPHRVLLECRLPNQESDSACRKPFLCLWPCASPFSFLPLSLPPPRSPPSAAPLHCSDSNVDTKELCGKYTANTHISLSSFPLLSVIKKCLAVGIQLYFFTLDYRILATSQCHW